jgi:hypothetical protein
MNFICPVTTEQGSSKFGTLQCSLCSRIIGDKPRFLRTKGSAQAKTHGVGSCFLSQKIKLDPGYHAQIDQQGEPECRMNQRGQLRIVLRSEAMLKNQRGQARESKARPRTRVRSWPSPFVCSGRPSAEGAHRSWIAHFFEFSRINVVDESSYRDGVGPRCGEPRVVQDPGHRTSHVPCEAFGALLAAR